MKKLVWIVAVVIAMAVAVTFEFSSILVTVCLVIGGWYASKTISVPEAHKVSNRYKVMEAVCFMGSLYYFMAGLYSVLILNEVKPTWLYIVVSGICVALGVIFHEKSRELRKIEDTNKQTIISPKNETDDSEN